MFPAQHLFILRTEQDIRDMTGAELLVGALDTGEELLGIDRNVGQRRGGGGAVVAVGTGFGGDGFAEVVEERLTAAGQLILRIPDNGVQVLYSDALLAAA